MPRATQAELWDISPSSRRKFGDDFVLLSPTSSTPSNEEMFLQYGVHSNATLFAEYGFVNWLDSEHDNASGCELELGKVIETLFSEREPVGSWMREVLIEEGYWG